MDLLHYPSAVVATALVVGLATTFTPLPAQAQAERPAAVAAPDPLDAAVGVAPTVYRSPLASYARDREPTIDSWAKANETVNRVGGWRAYARESAAERNGAEPNRPGAPATDPHAGHGGAKR